MPSALAPILVAAIINLNALSAAPDAQPEIIQSEPPAIETVEVVHKQKGMLLALVPITFTVRAVADARGNVRIDYPWYSKITVDRRQEVETRARIAVNGAIKESLVGSVVAAGESDNPRFTEAEAKTVEKVLINVLKEAMDGVDRSP